MQSSKQATATRRNAGQAKAKAKAVASKPQVEHLEHLKTAADSIKARSLNDLRTVIDGILNASGDRFTKPPASPVQSTMLLTMQVLELLGSMDANSGIQPGSMLRHPRRPQSWAMVKKVISTSRDFLSLIIRFPSAVDIGRVNEKDVQIARMFLDGPGGEAATYPSEPRVARQLLKWLEAAVRYADFKAGRSAPEVADQGVMSQLTDNTAEFAEAAERAVARLAAHLDKERIVDADSMASEEAGMQPLLMGISKEMHHQQCERQPLDADEGSQATVTQDEQDIVTLAGNDANQSLMQGTCASHDVDKAMLKEDCSYASRAAHESHSRDERAIGCLMDELDASKDSQAAEEVQSQQNECQSLDSDELAEAGGMKAEHSIASINDANKGIVTGTWTSHDVDKSMLEEDCSNASRVAHESPSRDEHAIGCLMDELDASKDSQAAQEVQSQQHECQSLDSDVLAKAGGMKAEHSIASINDANEGMVTGTWTSHDVDKSMVEEDCSYASRAAHESPSRDEHAIGCLMDELDASKDSQAAKEVQSQQNEYQSLDSDELAEAGGMKAEHSIASINDANKGMVTGTWTSHDVVKAMVQEDCSYASRVAHESPSRDEHAIGCPMGELDASKDSQAAQEVQSQQHECQSLDSDELAEAGGMKAEHSIASINDANEGMVTGTWTSHDVDKSMLEEDRFDASRAAHASPSRDEHAIGCPMDELGSSKDRQEAEEIQNHQHQCQSLDADEKAEASGMKAEHNIAAMATNDANKGMVIGTYTNHSVDTSMRKDGCSVGIPFAHESHGSGEHTVCCLIDERDVSDDRAAAEVQDQPLGLHVLDIDEETDESVGKDEQRVASKVAHETNQGMVHCSQDLGNALPEDVCSAGIAVAHECPSSDECTTGSLTDELGVAEDRAAAEVQHQQREHHSLTVDGEIEASSTQDDQDTVAKGLVQGTWTSHDGCKAMSENGCSLVGLDAHERLSSDEHTIGCLMDELDVSEDRTAEVQLRQGEHQSPASDGEIEADSTQDDQDVFSKVANDTNQGLVQGTWTSHDVGKAMSEDGCSDVRLDAHECLNRIGSLMDKLDVSEDRGAEVQHQQFEHQSLASDGEVEASSTQDYRDLASKAPNDTNQGLVKGARASHDVDKAMSEDGYSCERLDAHECLSRIGCLMDELDVSEDRAAAEVQHQQHEHQSLASDGEVEASSTQDYQDLASKAPNDTNQGLVKGAWTSHDVGKTMSEDGYSRDRLDAHECLSRTGCLVDELDVSEDRAAEVQRQQHEHQSLASDGEIEASSTQDDPDFRADNATNQGLVKSAWTSHDVDKSMSEDGCFLGSFVVHECPSKDEHTSGCLMDEVDASEDNAAEEVQNQQCEHQSLVSDEAIEANSTQSEQDVPPQPDNDTNQCLVQGTLTTHSFDNSISDDGCSAPTLAAHAFPSSGERYDILGQNVSSAEHVIHECSPSHTGHDSAKQVPCHSLERDEEFEAISTEDGQDVASRAANDANLSLMQSTWTSHDFDQSMFQDGCSPAGSVTHDPSSIDDNAIGCVMGVLDVAEDHEAAEEVLNQQGEPQSLDTDEDLMVSSIKDDQEIATRPVEEVHNGLMQCTWTSHDVDRSMLEDDCSARLVAHESISSDERNIGCLMDELDVPEDQTAEVQNQQRECQSVAIDGEVEASSSKDDEYVATRTAQDLEQGTFATDDADMSTLKGSCSTAEPFAHQPHSSLGNEINLLMNQLDVFEDHPAAVVDDPEDSLTTTHEHVSMCAGAAEQGEKLTAELQHARATATEEEEHRANLQLQAGQLRTSFQASHESLFHAQDQTAPKEPTSRSMRSSRRCNRCRLWLSTAARVAYFVGRVVFIGVPVVIYADTLRRYAERQLMAHSEGEL